MSSWVLRPPGAGPGRSEKIKKRGGHNFLIFFKHIFFRQSKFEAV